MKSAKELLENIKAREELEKRGWKKEKCQCCGGLGFVRGLQPCLACDGRGGFWYGPLRS